MAKLKDIGGLEQAKKKTSKEVPVTLVKGDVVRRYNEACDQIDRAEAVCKELAPELHEIGLEYVFAHNCENGENPKRFINSVNIQDGADDAEPGQTVMFTWTRKAKAMDAAAVEALFNDPELKTTARKPANVNDYVAWVPKADFDAKVFMVAEKGRMKFSQERYDAFRKAIQAVADEFSVTNPLSTSKVFGPVEDFQDRRFKDFTAEQNQHIAEVMPTTVSLSPVRLNEDAG